MEFGTPQFWLAGIEIIVINILLSGDNAVVIALACRNLPAHQRRWGVFWGAGGAIALRIVLTFFAISVAAAAKGSLFLLVFGLVVSIPLVIVGSQLIMKAIERFPILVMAGGGLLGYVAGEMAVTDNAVAGWINEHAHWLHWALPVACILLVIGVARLMQMRSGAGGDGPPA